MSNIIDEKNEKDNEPQCSICGKTASILYQFESLHKDKNWYCEKCCPYPIYAK